MFTYNQLCNQAAVSLVKKERQTVQKSSKEFKRVQKSSKEWRHQPVIFQVRSSVSGYF